MSQIYWLWDANNAPLGIYIVSADGKHFEINEPCTPDDPAYYDHKNECAGVTYLMAMALRESRIVHWQGPYPASTNDAGMYVLGVQSLRSKVLATRGKVVADSALQHHDEVGGAPNEFHTKRAKVFFGRARCRQECVFCRLTVFKVLKDNFRHSKKSKRTPDGIDPVLENHRIMADAVCVTVQYQFENGSPIWDLA